MVSKLIQPELLKVNTFYHASGNLSIIDPKNDSNLPFSIRRVYFLWNLSENTTRGSHAHKELQQLIIAINGSLRIVLKRENARLEFFLNKPDIGLYVPPGWWRELYEFTLDSRLIVIASQEYKESDYIRDEETFKRWVLKND
jgi:hypothetical protein